MKKFAKQAFGAPVDTVSMSPGEMLATLRQLQGLTQAALAKAAGMTQANISSMESGRQQIGRDRALVLAKPLHVHPAVILFPHYEVSPPPQRVVRRPRPRAGAITQRQRKLPNIRRPVKVVTARNRDA